MAIYLDFMGSFWKVNDQQWRDIVEQGAKDGSFVLPEETQLRNRPKFIKAQPDGDLICENYDHEFHRVGRWTTEQFQDHLRGMINYDRIDALLSAGEREFYATVQGIRTKFYVAEHANVGRGWMCMQRDPDGRLKHQVYSEQEMTDIKEDGNE